MVFGESSTTSTLLVTSICALGFYRVWCDILQFMYHRERIRSCVNMAHEGIGLLRLAVERGVLGQLGDSVGAVLADIVEEKTTPPETPVRRQGKKT